MATRPDGVGVRGLSQQELCDRVSAIVSRRGGAASVESFREQSWVRLPREGMLEVFRELRDDRDLAFDMLLDVTAVHFPRRPMPLGAFDVVYHLLSIAKGHRLRLKIACADPEAGVDSLVGTWPGADFMEREAFDMFGVRFHGHPNLKRILMADDFDGFPMRKDFPYRGH